eukprot:9354897-Pyramimonas_sp.AAC.1
MFTECSLNVHCSAAQNVWVGPEPMSEQTSTVQGWLEQGGDTSHKGPNRTLSRYTDHSSGGTWHSPGGVTPR